MPPIETSTLYAVDKREALVAYLLWFLAGWFGAHRFYLRRGSARYMLAAGIASFALFLTGPGWLLLLLWIVLSVVVVADLFLIPGWVRDANLALARSLARPAA